jgi:ABC-type hemin transport system ATPase subunit
MQPSRRIASTSASKRQSGVKLLKSDTDLRTAEGVVVVMGPTGAGKSRFIREATGEYVAVGDTLESCKYTSKYVYIAHNP